MLRAGLARVTARAARAAARRCSHTSGGAAARADPALLLRSPWAAFAAGFAAAGALAHAVPPGASPPGAACEAAPQPQPQPQFLSPNFLADAAEKASPAVVNITSAVGGRLGAYLGVASSGSGFIISPDGTVLTNAHVVADAAAGAGAGAALTLSLQDGRTFAGRVEALDAASDIAIVRVVDPPAAREGHLALPCVALGCSAALRPGEWVLALGSPLHLRNSVTAGIVSSVDRKAAELGLRGRGVEFIQTDAAVNEGNSGGPLVNLAGEVVGISAMKALAAQGISFAIPIDAAKAIVEQLRANGRVIRPYLGVKLLELSPAVAAQLREREPNFPAVERGVLLPAVAPGSPAARGGLRAGDVIVAWGDAPTATTRALLAALARSVGAPAQVRVLRPGAAGEITLRVTAEEAVGLQ
jgi:HtrA serine peptidase 2